MSIFSSIGRAVFGPSDKELIEESMETSSRYSSVPGRPSSLHETDAQTDDEKTIVRTHNERIARGYHWDGRRWVCGEEEEEHSWKASS